MNIYTSDNWEVIFGKWSQDHPGYCIIASKKERLSDLTPEEWMELGKLEKELERIQSFDSYKLSMSCDASYIQANGRVKSLPNYSECVTYTVTYKYVKNSATLATKAFKIEANKNFDTDVQSFLKEEETGDR